jgi:hypothetical protein
MQHTRRGHKCPSRRHDIVDNEHVARGPHRRAPTTSRMQTRTGASLRSRTPRLRRTGIARQKSFGARSDAARHNTRE